MRKCLSIRIVSKISLFETALISGDAGEFRFHRLLVYRCLGFSYGSSGQHFYFNPIFVLSLSRVWIGGILWMGFMSYMVLKRVFFDTIRGQVTLDGISSRKITYGIDFFES